MIGIPGETNPLGYVRVLMPNRYNTYLHDTNHPELFDKPERTYSSGCIRMERPVDIANFVLSGNADWDQSMAQPILESAQKTEVDLAAPIPVYVIHQTIWLDSAGELVFGADIYKRDKELVEVLQAMGGLHLPRGSHYAIAAPDIKTLASNSLIP
jgi:murein L,D-transpeptidase YcbB/YkuD